MANRHGDFIWYDLMTSDINAAKTFYGPLLGWTFKDSGQSDRDYHLASMNGHSICGFMQIPEGVDIPSYWLGHIAVGDIQGAALAIKNDGGQVLMEPWEIPNVGWIAYVADPQGAMFYIMQPSSPGDYPDERSLAFAAETPMIGHCGWNELMSADQQSAMSFYAKQFTWKAEDESMDMGEAGTYVFFSHSGHFVAGVMTKPDEMPISTWIHYFRVADIDDAVKTIVEQGGQTIGEPMPIPGDDFMIQGLDPQHALFALVGPRTAKTVA